ncbi:MAG: hypothetical protein G3M78_01055 [Candidatus Nitrohelix vancouverensis]|uniref:Sulfotransferase domain-containing protein n=1 Tax=Candidatus Nitrohelix vancouverensis TaxID=2705534 RepID=A0A7T0G288_9BACT|nr:MAG: hypothetical protein G3M78_01055 [Candidatus Nitrohelix vancouverensis]
MKIDFLQVGFHKCGTSFINTNIYDIHPEIHCVHANENLELERLLLMKFILQDGLEYNSARFEKAFNVIGANLLSEQAHAINGLNFGPLLFMYRRRFDRKVIIERIRNFFGEVKVITCIRNQSTWLTGHYSHYLKSGGLLAFDDFLESFFHNPYLYKHEINWLPSVALLHELFGKDRVLVCLYEELNDAPQRFTDKITGFLETQPLAVNPEKVNPSMTRFGMFLKRMSNHLVRYDEGESDYAFKRDLYEANPSYLARAKQKFIYSFYKNATIRLSQKGGELFGGNIKIKLKASQLKKIKMEYGKDNMELSKLLDIDLGKYGYY